MLSAFSFKSWKEENQDMQRNLAIQASFAAKNSQTVFDNIGDGMDLLGKLLVTMGVADHPELARADLIEFQADHPEVSSVTLVSPSGAMLLTTNAAPGEALPDFRQAEAYLRAFLFDLNNTYSYNIGRNQFGMGMDRWRFPFRHTVLDNSGKPVFVIQVDISVESAALLWSDLPLFPESRVGLMRNDGYIQLIWPNPGSEQLLNKPETGALVQTLHSRPGVIAGAYEGKSSIDDIVRLGAYTHLPNANMAAFVSVPKKLIMIRWWEHNYPILLSFLVYLGVISGIAFKLSAREQEHTHDLLNQSRKDPLTGLPNRLAINEILTREIARDRRQEEHSAILYLNLDKFKDIKIGRAHV